MSLVEAASECGYSADHLGRLVRSGQIPNAGRANAPKVRRRDLPKKTRCLPDLVGFVHTQADRRRIAASVLTLNQRGQDG